MTCQTLKTRRAIALSRPTERRRMPFHVVPATGTFSNRCSTTPTRCGVTACRAKTTAKRGRRSSRRRGASTTSTASRWSTVRTCLSSAKRYDLSVRVDGRIRRVLGIGALFTAPAHRGRGCARELITRMLDTAVTEGQEFAMLFSEIAPAFYERLDFVPVPLLESTLEVDQKRGGAPAMLVRSGDDAGSAADRRDERGALRERAAGARSQRGLHPLPDHAQAAAVRIRRRSAIATPSSWSSKKVTRRWRIWSAPNRTAAG